MYKPFVAMLLTLLLFLPAAGEDWPQFRGPGGQGHCSEQGIPLSWSETENIAWKVPIPGLGWSSPVLKDGQIWLTTALEDGHSLRALRIDRGSGRIVFDVEIFEKDDPGKIHSKNSHASPTPILEDDRVYVHYGAHGTACLRTNGQIVWKNILDYSHQHGPAGSPVIEKNLLIISCDGTDQQYIVALDKMTGKIRWKRSRDGRQAYSTPLVITASDQRQLISTGGDRVIAYDPTTGKQIWWSRYDGYSLVPRPVYGHGLVFICSGYNVPLVYAIRPTGTQDVTSSHVVWSLKAGAPHNPSPILVGDELYIVSDRGILSCLDARTGKIHWRERLEGGFSTSPLHTDGRIYFSNEKGVTTVIGPGTQYKRLAVNSVEGRTLASLAVSEKSIYLRTDKHLYRIEEGAGTGQ